MADINLGVGGANSATGGYEIANSLKLNSANSEYLYETRDTSGSDWNRLLWTASMWVKHIPTPDSNVNPKERIFGAADANNDFDIRFRGEPLGFRNNSDVDGVGELLTNALYRDYSAWMHIVAVWDTANSTAGNRMRLYVNGEEVTSFSTDTQPSQNEKSIWGKKNDGTDGNVTHTIGGWYNYYSGFSQGLNGYLAEVHWVEGQALAPSDFGEFDEDSGIWKPIEYTGSYGTNGFYLKFEDSSNLGLDSSGNSHNWSLNNITAADQATDTPTNNFCTLNQAAFTLTDATISQGATSFFNTVSSTRTAVATMAVTKGKWYFEYKLISTGGSTYWAAIGFAKTESTSSSLNAGANSETSTLLLPNGTPFENGTIGSSNFSYFTSNDIGGVALDVDNGNMYFYKNGTIQNSGNPVFTNIGDFIMPLGTTYTNGCGGYFNFGGFTSYTPASPASDENGYGTFEYAPPSGYYALCTKNLAEYG